MNGTLSRDRVRAFYDRFGAKQDSQSFYEDAALADLIAAADLPQVESVFELGCGTGRLAARLLGEHLPANATYQGVDLSSTMIGLAHTRLLPYGQRAHVWQIDGADPWSGVRLPVDRIVTTYVLDLLPREEIDAFLRSSANALTDRGRLCVASITLGNTTPSRVVMAGWRALFRLSPRLTGGCRPIQIAEMLPSDDWQIVHRSIVSSFGIASEVVVAQRRSR